MKASTSLSRVIILSFVLFFAITPGVFAHESFATYLPTNLRTWNTYGTPTVTTSTVTLQGSDKEWVYVDIDVRTLTSSYVALAAYVDKDDTRTTYTSSDRNRSGNPYLYAYYLDRNGKIIKYLSGSELMETTRKGSDHVVYGIFPTVSGATSMRVFLKQSSVKNLSNKGVNVTFTTPVLISGTSRQQLLSHLKDFAKENVQVQFSSSR
ncbi:hypothetical protein HQ487_01410 [Candidatus Uhrbacteria bacterium]|nr:hypothetical protein [Candidatus Uhrbacteria bacterium]